MIVLAIAEGMLEIDVYGRPLNHAHELRIAIVCALIALSRYSVETIGAAELLRSHGNGPLGVVILVAIAASSLVVGFCYVGSSPALLAPH